VYIFDLLLAIKLFYSTLIFESSRASTGGIPDVIKDQILEGIV